MDHSGYLTTTHDALVGVLHQQAQHVEYWADVVPDARRFVYFAYPLSQVVGEEHQQRRAHLSTNA